jgi:hypothetical protein
VLKPGGSLFVNLGDTFANDAKWGGASNAKQSASDEPTAIGYRQRKRTGIPAKSRIGAPWRYAIRCIDELGLILRADIIWAKPNGLPESVTDRVRMSHEYVFHFTKQGRYFAAIDEVREEHAGPPVEHFGTITAANVARQDERTDGLARTSIASARPRLYNPLGKAPGSVWQIASEPLQVPAELGVDHFAAFPSELARRCILGWTPSGWCTACGEARRAVVETRITVDRGGRQFNPASGNIGVLGKERESTITGDACACTPYTDHPGQRIPAASRTGNRLAVDPGNAPRQTSGSLGDQPRVGPWREYHFDGWTPAPTTPAVVLDPFAGTGTAPAVAHHLGRHGIGVDLSRDYLRLAEWRCSSDTRLKDKVLDRSGIPNPQPPAVDGQMNLFGEGAA